MAFAANEPLDKFESKHEIFPSKSPVSNIDPVVEKPAPVSRRQYGRLAELAFSRIKPLMKTREALNKVYSDSYFENHYPEADKTLKGLLHNSTMDAWSNAENPSEEVLADKADGQALGKTIHLTINLG